MENATRRSEEISHRLVSSKHLIDLIDGRRLLGRSAGPPRNPASGRTDAACKRSITDGTIQRLSESPRLTWLGQRRIISEMSMFAYQFKFLGYIDTYM
jgi:hypothetical protein